jgi:hypothetical protein
MTAVYVAFVFVVYESDNMPPLGSQSAPPNDIFHHQIMEHDDGLFTSFHTVYFCSQMPLFVVLRFLVAWIFCLFQTQEGIT